jgi:hypothetical protein
MVSAKTHVQGRSQSIAQATSTAHSGESALKKFVMVFRCTGSCFLREEESADGDE